MIQQQLHEDDLSVVGVRYEAIPVGPGLEIMAALEQLRRDLGPVTFSAQYPQEPVTPEINMIRLEWFGTYVEAPPRYRFLKVVQSWDTSMTSQPTSDYSVCTTWGFELESHSWAGHLPVLPCSSTELSVN